MVSEYYSNPFPDRRHRQNSGFFYDDSNRKSNRSRIDNERENYYEDNYRRNSHSMLNDDRYDDFGEQENYWPDGRHSSRHESYYNEDRRNFSNSFRDDDHNRESFFSRVGERIKNTWNDLTHPSDRNVRDQYHNEGRYHHPSRSHDGYDDHYSRPYARDDRYNGEYRTYEYDNDDNRYRTERHAAGRHPDAEYDRYPLQGGPVTYGNESYSRQMNRHDRRKNSHH